MLIHILVECGGWFGSVCMCESEREREIESRVRIWGWGVSKQLCESLV